MQEGGKIVIAVSMTFTVGVITGWLLNTYTRKVGWHQSRVEEHVFAVMGPGTASDGRPRSVLSTCLAPASCHGNSSSTSIRCSCLCHPLLAAWAHPHLNASAQDCSACAAAYLVM
jgi:hypothetical protein